MKSYPLKNRRLNPSLGKKGQERRKGDRRIAFRRADDQARQISLKERERKLNSLLEMGQLIGLDLEIHGMPIKLNRKASELMDADRCSLFPQERMDFGQR